MEQRCNKGENRSTRGKTCPSASLSTTNPTWTDPGSNPALRDGRPAANRLSHGTAQTCVLVVPEQISALPSAVMTGCFAEVLRFFGDAVAQLVEALRYKPEGRGFDSRMVSLEFFLSVALWPWSRLSL
jgi:hypothetical protein